MANLTKKKMLYVLLTGGMLLQVGSCATVLAPIGLSLFESTALTTLFGQLF